MKKIEFLIIMIATMASSMNAVVTTSIDNISPTLKTISIPFNEQHNEQIPTKTIMVSVDHPHAHIINYSFAPAANLQYLKNYHDNVSIITEKTILQLNMSLDHALPIDANIYISYFNIPDYQNKQTIVPVQFNTTSDELLNNAKNFDTSDRNYQTNQTTSKTYTEKLQNFLENSNNIWLQLFFAFLLGILLSLTPCIYPMIPITLGILHNNAKQSMLLNFLRALSYAFGMSTMFAIMGLFAAFAGASFGGLLSNPFFVIILVLFIGYMSLTMIGILELQIPSFLQRNTNMNTTFNPYLSAYLFGIISGSVASPCVSPGLALLLAIVATMASSIAGFALLFCFGIGLSCPLIILATFSSSIQIFPKAGMWMVEIKKGLGFIMLATCLYYLSNIFPPFIIHVMTALYLLIVSIYYIIDAQQTDGRESKTIKSLIGIILLASGIVFISRIYDTAQSFTNQNETEINLWQATYQEALDQALKENKKLILDFWAHHCTICKAIDKKIFADKTVQSTLLNSCIFYKVDCTHKNTENSMLKNRFKVFAQPTILVINPDDQTILKRWSSEPYTMSPKEFIDQVESISL